MPNDPETRDAERDKLIEEMTAAVLDEGWSPDLEDYNPESKAVAKQKAREIAVRALAVAEAQADAKLALALRMIDRWLETDHPDNSLVGLPLERSHIGRLNLLRRTLKRARSW